MQTYPAYIQTMMAGTAALKRVVVGSDEDTQDDDAEVCCVMSLSEDLETVSFESTDSAWELPVSEITKIIHFEETSAEYLLGFLVPADRLVVALEFASDADLQAWSYGMQVLTYKEPEEEVEPEADLAAENQILREALAAREETVGELLSLVQTLIKRQLGSEPKLTPRTNFQVAGA